MPEPLAQLYLNRHEAAEYIRTSYGIPCSHATLAKYACGYGTTAGPVYRKINQKTVLYAKSDLDDWAKARIGPLQRTTNHGDFIT